jgi:hypothetical protein
VVAKNLFGGGAPTLVLDGGVAAFVLGGGDMAIMVLCGGSVVAVALEQTGLKWIPQFGSSW